MSEKAPLQRIEQDLQSEQFEQSKKFHEQSLPNSEVLREQTETQLANQRERIEQHARSSETYKIDSEKEHREHHPLLINKQLKDAAYIRSLTRTRKKLSLPSRAFSKVIHATIIDKPSEVIGATIARPSSLFGGAFLALVGTSLLLWITRHYGYEYNYFVALLLFVVGAIAGIAIELLYKFMKSKRS